MFADEEMRRAYGEDRDHECRDCGNRGSKGAAVSESCCVLTNCRRKCSDYGFACAKYKDSGKYRFVVK